VRARAQVVSFRLRRRLIGSELLAPLQARLPSTLRLLSWAEVGPSFHARASALAREYRYRLKAPPSEFDANAARHFLAGLLGTQDRRPYVWRPVRPTLSTLHTAELRPESDGLEFRFVADRYGRRQVRNMVWAALAAGRGEPSGANAERGWTGETAPAEALTLWHVTYAADPFLETG
jgi:tRNA pseudouridine38-40 synthase